VVARWSYALLLAVSLFTAVITTVSLNRPDVVTPGELESAVMVASLLSFALTGAITIYNPGTRWQQLRGAALALESEIWRFRTRSGSYSGSGHMDSDSEAAEVMLERYVEDLARHVLESGNMAETSLLARFDGIFGAPRGKKASLKYRHGQLSNARVDGTFGQSNRSDQASSQLWSSVAFLKDSALTKELQGTGVRKILHNDHHSPLTADEYLELRVRPHLAYYQGRLPSYARIRVWHETLMMATTIAGILLAFLGYASWGAAPAAVATVLTAWSKFVMVDKKLQRFSDAITSLDSLIRWWRLLSSVEKANLSKISQLVGGCEMTFQTERQGWVSTSMATHLLDAAAGSDSGTGLDEKRRKDKNQDMMPVGD